MSQLAAERKPMAAFAPVATARPPRLPRAAGQHLDPGTRRYMESHLGHDFGDVRIHADTQAAAASRSLHALAYTAGHDIVFGAGQYAPDTAAGRWLLAHELAHVVQQQGGTRPGVSSRGDRYEQEADRAADAALAGQRTSLAPAWGTPGLQCQDEDDPRRRFQLQSSIFPELTGGPRPGPFQLNPPGLFRPPLGSSGLGVPQLTLGKTSPLLFTTPPLGLRAYTPSVLAAAASLPLPSSATPPRAGTPAPQPVEPTPRSNLPQPGIDVGADLSVSQGNPTVLEQTVTVFIPGDVFQRSAGNFKFDFLHQPGVQVAVSPVAGAGPGSPIRSNAGVSLGATLLNIEFPRILEVGLGQVQWTPGGPTQVGVQNEFHVTDVFSITATGGFTIAPGGNGQNQATWGPFQLGVLFHQPKPKQ